jgi:hypothetical protein
MPAVDNLDRVVYNACKLTPEQVLYVLASDRTNRQLGEELGVNDSSIQKIRCGESYTHVHPEVPRPKAGARRKGPTCEQCVHLCNDRCSLSFPEFKHRSYRAAAVCAAYATGRVL